jgi:hypothetical protein
MRIKVVALLLAGAYVGAAIACGARSELPIPDPPEEGGGGQGGGPPECVVFNSSAELAPLDVFMMLDASGSMQFPTGNGQAKWWAVREALNAFFYDPESRAISVAVSFFPIIDESVAEVCTSDTNCGAPDTCKPFRACPSTNLPCISDQDCASSGDTCQTVGQCALQTLQNCFTDFDCGDDAPCNPLGFCENRFTCDSLAYEAPVAPLATLPDLAYQLVGAIDSTAPQGGTPTLPAVTGAVDGAVAHALDNPDHKVIVVLATDGFPTACDPALDVQDQPQAIANLAAAAAAGSSQGVNTFVIGVFSPEEQVSAEPNLTAIAQAGGTGQAFLVNGSGSVTTEFRDALNQVRVDAKSCQFDIVPGEDPIDYRTVWVRITIAGEPVWIERVDSIDACGQENGFYYDQPIDGPVQPSRILLCPNTCSLLGSSPNRTVEIFTTCPNPTG